ncbi:MAG: histidine kinase [Spirochaetaceae bacterium]|jgi:sensor histidine kinase YesM|nr:histidine kinase [Spirochaetaceae bacterium]
MKPYYRSFRVQIVLSTLGAFFLLILSTAYILLSTQKIQEFSKRNFEQERFLKSIQDDLAAYEGPLMEFLSTRSSNALAQIFIDTQNLRQKLPGYRQILGNPMDLKERELYALIFYYLNLADTAIEEKRGRNIPAYTAIYEEMDSLKKHINREIDTLSTERYRSQLGAYQQFLTESGALQLWNFIFIISMSVFSVLILLYSINRFTNPLVKLSAMTKELSSGNFNIPDMETGRGIEEFDQVIEAFNHMKSEISKYIEEIRWQENIKQEYMQEKLRNMKMEGLVRHMEIYALQAQMNPHFLFNTINTGMQLAIVEGADRTGEYMDYMARLFRHIIRNKEIIVPLRYEIRGLDYYFYIIRVRFPRNFTVTLDCGEELLDAYKVPVSILQPLVENSVIHAFKDAGEDFLRHITVGGRMEGKRLVLSVQDNGMGIPQEMIKKLLHPQPIDESSVSRVMGLENVIQRLYFFYPGDAGVVDIETGPQGTTVIIRIDTEREPCIAF